MTMAENKMTKEVLKAAKGTGSVEELQKLAKENGMELDAAQAEEMYARLHPVTQELSDDELDNVTGGDKAGFTNAGVFDAKLLEVAYGGFFQRAALWLHLCNLRLLRCNLLGSYFHQNTELIDFGWRDIFDGRRNNKKRAFR